MAKVLIVEDDLTLAEMYARKLNSNGLEVVTAFSGTEGFEKAEKESPNLILLDIMMPKLNGFDVLKELKQNLETKDIPVVVLTALTQDSDRQECLKLGAVDFLIKSDVTPNQVFEKIEKYIK